MTRFSPPVTQRLFCAIAAMLLAGSAAAQLPQQTSEIHFEPDSGRVTIRMPLRSARADFIQNVRPENFAVYEDGIRQRNVEVRVDHPPVSIGLLLEGAGRYPALTDTISGAVAAAARQLLDGIRASDRLTIWRYGEKVEEIAPPPDSPGHDARASLIQLPPPSLSELNFHDALLTTLPSMQAVTGRKALILICSGVDTFSKASFQDALRVAGQSGVPIYGIDVVPAVRHGSVESLDTAPYSRLNWKQAAARLRQIVKAAHGQVYAPASMLDLSAVYDDLLADLRAEYVITYKSPNKTSSARTVRIELVGTTSGGSAVTGGNGKSGRSRVLSENRYYPQSATVRALDSSVQNY